MPRAAEFVIADLEICGAVRVGADGRSCDAAGEIEPHSEVERVSAARQALERAGQHLGLGELQSWTLRSDAGLVCAVREENGGFIAVRSAPSHPADAAAKPIAAALRALLTAP